MEDEKVTATDQLIDHQAAMQKQVNDLSSQIVVLATGVFCLAVAMALMLWKVRSVGLMG